MKRRPTKIRAAPPPLEGATLHLRGYVSQEVNEKSGSITPFAGGKMLPASTNVVL